MADTSFQQLLVQFGAPATRQTAEAQLQQLEAANFTQYVGLLVQELSRPNGEPHIRQQAGTLVKIALRPVDTSLQPIAAQKWMAIDPTLRQQIKDAVVAILADPVHHAALAASSLISTIAQIEMPLGQWPTVMQQLLSGCGVVPGVQIAEAHKQASLQAIGYLCADIADELLAPLASEILSAVVAGMQQSNPEETRRIAATALLDALGFIHENFQLPTHRDIIMQAICECTLGRTPELRIAAFMCLIQVAYLYYDNLTPYMIPLYNVTMTAARNDPSEDVQKSAIEFWSTIATNELQLLRVMQEAKENGEEFQDTSMNYIRGALAALVELLTECLLKPVSDSDPDAYTIQVAAATCLALCASTVEVTVSTVMPFIEQNLQQADPRRRHAALFAFGSIMEGDETMLMTLVPQAVPVLLQCLVDQSSSEVRYISAWCLSRVAMHVPAAVAEQLPSLLTSMLPSLADTPRVAAEIAWALSNFAEAYATDDPEEATTPISPVFAPIVQGLMMCADRVDDPDNKVQPNAYEAISQMINATGLDCAPLLLQLLPAIVDRIGSVSAMPVVSEDDRETRAQLQAHLCSVVHAICLKMPKKDNDQPALAQYADRVMAPLLHLLTTNHPTVVDDALMAIGVFAHSIGPFFASYMNSFFPLHLEFLRRPEMSSTCGVAVNVIDDICHALGQNMATCADHYVNAMLLLLANSEISLDIKPRAFGAIGAICLALGPHFLRYLGPVMEMLLAASAYGLTPDEYDNADLVDYLCRLRKSIFECMSIVVQTLTIERQAQLLEPSVPGIVNFVQRVWHDSDALTRDQKRLSIFLLGDLASALHGTMRPVLLAKDMQLIITTALADQQTTIRQAAQWVQKLATKTSLA